MPVTQHTACDSATICRPSSKYPLHCASLGGERHRTNMISGSPLPLAGVFFFLHIHMNFLSLGSSSVCVCAHYEYNVNMGRSLLLSLCVRPKWERESALLIHNSGRIVDALGESPTLWQPTTTAALVKSARGPLGNALLARGTEYFQVN